VAQAIRPHARLRDIAKDQQYISRDYDIGVLDELTTLVQTNNVLRRHRPIAARLSRRRHVLPSSYRCRQELVVGVGDSHLRLASGWSGWKLSTVLARYHGITLFKGT
jgi:hypothetical protein